MRIRTESGKKQAIRTMSRFQSSRFEFQVNLKPGIDKTFRHSLAILTTSNDSDMLNSVDACRVNPLTQGLGAQ